VSAHTAATAARNEEVREVLRVVVEVVVRVVIGVRPFDLSGCEWLSLTPSMMPVRYH
jgi:hypothetical protein